MGAGLSENEKFAMGANYSDKSGVDATNQDIMWNTDAIKAGQLIDREDPAIQSLYTSFQ